MMMRNKSKLYYIKLKLYYFLIFNMDNKEIIDILNQIRKLIHDYVIKNKINFTYCKQNTLLKNRFRFC